MHGALVAGQTSAHLCWLLLLAATLLFGVSLTVLWHVARLCCWSHGMCVQERNGVLWVFADSSVSQAEAEAAGTVCNAFVRALVPIVRPAAVV